MPICIYILTVKENGHELQPVYKKWFRDIRLWLTAYFVHLGQNEDDIPTDRQKFLGYCASFDAVPDVRIRIDELVTMADPDAPVHSKRLV